MGSIGRELIVGQLEPNWVGPRAGRSETQGPLGSHPMGPWGPLPAPEGSSPAETQMGRTIRGVLIKLILSGTMNRESQPESLP